MGQTVSLNSCVTGGSVVRVMRTDGEFDEFDFPCIAAEAMVRNPGHFVVHCSPVDKTTAGLPTTVTIMLPDAPLLPGQPYMLYPIPDNHQKTVARSKSFSMIKRKLAAPNAPAAVTHAEKRQGRRKALKMILTRLHLATFVASNITENSAPTHPATEHVSTQQATKETTTLGEDGGNEDDDDELSIKLPNPATLNFAWRPMLSMIPESPLGFHSRPDSPVGLYKLDSPVAPSSHSTVSRAPSSLARVTTI